MRDGLCGWPCAAWVLAALVLLPGAARPDQPDRSNQPDRLQAGAELRLTLDEAVALALERSPRLRGARAAVAAAEAQRKQARAQFGPKLQIGRAHV